MGVKRIAGENNNNFPNNGINHNAALIFLEYVKPAHNNGHYEKKKKMVFNTFPLFTHIKLNILAQMQFLWSSKKVTCT